MPDRLIWAARRPVGVGALAPACFTWGVFNIFPNIFKNPFRTSSEPEKADTLQGANTTQRGGNWNNGSNAGPFYWNLNNTSSSRNRNIGTHLHWGDITLNNGKRVRRAPRQNKRSKRCAGSAPAGAYRTLGNPPQSARCAA